MTLSTTLFLLAGVLLNAGAQLLLKAGVNAVGPIHFGASALWPTVGRQTNAVVLLPSKELPL